MTHPITEPTQSIRDRCIAKAREAYRATECSECAFDAILAEMEKPSEGIIHACQHEAHTQNVALDEDSPPLFFGPVFTAAIQHIRGGGK